jgi:hypothetical protein
MMGLVAPTSEGVSGVLVVTLPTLNLASMVMTAKASFTRVTAITALVTHAACSSRAPRSALD